MRASVILRGAVLALFAALLSGCGYNQIQQKDEAVKAGWSEVLNQYKRRADLIPNLDNTVKGYAAHEAQVLTAVTEARAKVSNINVNADDAASLAQYQAAQVAAESAYTAELVQCVDKSETLAESKACRALVDARWGVTQTVTTKSRPK